jgi:hypothetical protein
LLDCTAKLLLNFVRNGKIVFQSNYCFIFSWTMHENSCILSSLVKLVSVFSLFLLSYYCCTRGTVWHLQKFLQYTLVKFTPSIILLYPTFPHSWSTFFYFHTWVHISTVLPSYTCFSQSLMGFIYITHCCLKIHSTDENQENRRAQL